SERTGTRTSRLLRRRSLRARLHERSGRSSEGAWHHPPGRPEGVQGGELVLGSAQPSRPARLPVRGGPQLGEVRRPRRADRLLAYFRLPIGKRSTLEKDAHFLGLTDE